MCARLVMMMINHQRKRKAHAKPSQEDPRQTERARLMRKTVAQNFRTKLSRKICARLSRKTAAQDCRARRAKPAQEAKKQLISRERRAPPSSRPPWRSSLSYPRPRSPDPSSSAPRSRPRPRRAARQMAAVHQLASRQRRVGGPRAPPAEAKRRSPGRDIRGIVVMCTSQALIPRAHAGP